MTDRQELLRAKTLFENFHGRSPRGNELIRIGGFSAQPYGLLVGSMIALEYKSIGDGEKYHHDFEGHHPLLYVNETGRQIFVLGGSYTFTGRGFVK